MENNKNNELHPSIQEIAGNEHQARLAKLKALQEKGINPWPEFREVNATCKEALEEFESSLSSDKRYEISGRLVSIREHGKTIFAHIQDRSGKLQLYFKAQELGELFEILTSCIDIGDIIWCGGKLFRTKMGEITLHVETFELLSKCLFPLPEKYHGLSDIEVRYRQRYLDLISNDESAKKFKLRSSIIQAIRTFLSGKDFIEVETPMLHPIAGGANARPFITHHNAYDMPLYLRIAPELYLKRLVVGGFERVFEINRNFRNEGVSTRHNPEFTMLEFYMAYGDYKKGMELVEELFRFVLAGNFSQKKLPFKDVLIDYEKPFERLSIRDALLSIGGFSASELDEKSIDRTLAAKEISLEQKNARYGEKLWALFEECVEHKIFEPTFITGHPLEVSPLAKKDPSNPLAVARFELFVGGMELANGFTELNDPFDQAERFRMQLASGHDEAHQFDSDYIHALEYGLPPTVGVGIGIDRLVMLLTDTPSIKDVILFPTMKLKKDEISEGNQ